MAEANKKESPYTEADEHMAITGKENVSVQLFRTLSPKKLGNCYALCYKKGNPLVTIGPNCSLSK